MDNDERAWLPMLGVLDGSPPTPAAGIGLLVSTYAGLAAMHLVDLLATSRPAERREIRRELAHRGSSSSSAFGLPRRYSRETNDATRRQLAAAIAATRPRGFEDSVESAAVASSDIESAVAFIFALGGADSVRGRQAVLRLAGRAAGMQGVEAAIATAAHLAIAAGARPATDGAWMLAWARAGQLSSLQVEILGRAAGQFRDQAGRSVLDALVARTTDLELRNLLLALRS